jgi:SAM-dependent MidA family methyltransferase
MSDPDEALLSEIVAEIGSRGPMPFARYMDLCLYHPRLGYYSRGVGGGGGRDYLTSSGLHRAFGALVARQAEEMWNLLDRPGRFDFVEFGPGEGTFAGDVLGASASRPEFAAALRYVLVETSTVLRARQRERLAGRVHGRVTWAGPGELDRIGPLTGCLFANEVLDAFPVHRVVGTPEGPREVHVSVRDGRPEEILAALSDPAIARFFEESGLVPEEGQELDLNLAAPRFVARALGLLERGWFVIVDYGDESRGVYHPARRRGTLRACHRHRIEEDLLARPGDQDLTADVDFTAVRRAVDGSGGRVLGLTTQSRFLLALGALDFLQDPATLPTGGAEALAAYQEREALKDLILPGRMGERFRVMIAAAGAVPDRLTGLRDPFAARPAVAAGSGARVPAAAAAAGREV